MKINTTALLAIFFLLLGAACGNKNLPVNIQVTEIKGINSEDALLAGTQIIVFVEASGTSDLSFTWEDSDGILQRGDSSSLRYTVPSSLPNNFIKVSVKDKNGNQKIKNINYTVILPTPTVGPSIVSFSENFEDGSADGFLNKTGLWDVIKDETNINNVLDINTLGMPDEWAVIDFGESDWTNFVFSIRVRIIEYTSDAPIFNMQFREIYGVAITPRWNNFDLVITNPWTLIAGRQPKIETNKWYLIVIETKDENIKVYLDGQVMINEKVNTKSMGRLHIGLWPNNHVQIDDITVLPNR